MAVSSAGRHVQFVGGDDAQFRITYLPPPLMSDDRSLDGAWRWFSILYVSNRSRCHQDQHEHDQDRQDCPGKFDLIASVNLWGLARFITGAVSKTDEPINEQAGNNDEDNGANCENQDGSLFDLLSGLGEWAEDASDAVVFSKCGVDVPKANDAEERKRKNGYRSQHQLITVQMYPHANSNKKN